MAGTGLDSLFNSALTATVINVKLSGGRLYGIEVQNANTVNEFIQVFDAVAANVTLGTTTPKLSLALPKGVSASDVGIMDKWWDLGIDFRTGISLAATTTPTGLTAPTTALVINVLYK